MGVSPPSETTERAVALLADAFARRYRYPPAYAGWVAHARFGPPGHERDATVAVAGAGDVRTEVTPGLAPTQHEWLRQELRSLSRTLYGHDVATGEGRYAMSLDDAPHPLGPRVVLHGDPHAATFRVRKHRVTEATRRAGALLETVRVDRWHVRPDGRWLPAQWTFTVSDDDGARTLRVDRYWDVYWPLRGELVPQMRRVESVDAVGIRLLCVLHMDDWRPGPPTA